MISKNKNGSLIFLNLRFFNRELSVQFSISILFLSTIFSRTFIMKHYLIENELNSQI